MRNSHPLCSTVLIAAMLPAVLVRAQLQFQPPTPGELKMTADPDAPGADAVYLNIEETDNNPMSYESHYARIKVLTEKGKEMATVELPYLNLSSKVTDIKGRTIHADGTIVPLNVKPEDLKVDVFRASGAGGQHVNRTESAVRMTHLPTGIVVQCQNERSQHKNRASALKQMRARLYEYELEKKRAADKKVEDSKLEINFGSQIRSYVLAPYRMVKDHRTKLSIGDVDRVLDGDLDRLMHAFLVFKHTGKIAGDGKEDLPE